MLHVTKLLILFTTVLTSTSAALAVPCPADVAAALRAVCPCAGKPGPGGVLSPWPNHGQFVSCVAHFRNTLKTAGCSTAASDVAVPCAANSTCGRTTAVICCMTQQGTCSDPMPGDAIRRGRCGNDPRATCDTARDCTRTRAAVVAAAAKCATTGGTSIGGGSACATCPAPAP